MHISSESLFYTSEIVFNPYSSFIYATFKCLFLSRAPSILTASLKITFRPKFASSECMTSHLLIRTKLPFFMPVISIHMSVRMWLTLISILFHWWQWDHAKRFLKQKRSISCAGLLAAFRKFATTTTATNKAQLVQCFFLFIFYPFNKEKRWRNILTFIHCLEWLREHQCSALIFNMFNHNQLSPFSVKLWKCSFWVARQLDRMKLLIAIVSVSCFTERKTFIHTK